MEERPQPYKALFVFIERRAPACPVTYGTPRMARRFTPEISRRRPDLRFFRVKINCRDHRLYDVDGTKNMLDALVGTASENQMSLAQLINSTKPLECGVVNDGNLFRIEPNKTGDRKKELQTV